jgi:predicted ATPase with chaperone activity
MMRIPLGHIAASMLLAARLHALHKREQASFDLPSALGILAGSGQIAAERFGRHAVVGELALDGNTRPAARALSMAMAAAKHNRLIRIPSVRTKSTADLPMPFFG